MDGASSILLLLQVCASSLSRINSQKKQSKSESIFTFGNEVRGSFIVITQAFSYFHLLQLCSYRPRQTLMFVLMRKM